jgi:hypothetical protein
MLAAVLTVCFAGAAKAQSKFEITPGADLVSSYVWRGMYQTGVSFQPSLNVSTGGFSFGFWGSTDFASVGGASAGIPKEFDFSAGWTFGAFSVTLYDYWWAGEGAKYVDYDASHFIEASVGFSAGKFSFGANTMLKEGNGGDAGYEQQFSTYLTAAIDFEVKGIECSAGLGVSPWTGMYHRLGTEGFVVSSLSLKASKAIKVSDSFSLPVFTEVIVAPNQDNAFLVFGVSL